MSGTYRYTGTTWYRNGVVVESGDTVDGVTDAELESFGDTLEPVDGTEVEEEVTTVAEVDDEADVDVDEDADADYECGAETSSGGTCSRSVDSPDERCWAHTED